MKRYLKNIGLACILAAGALFLTHCGSGGGDAGVTSQGAGQPAVALPAQMQQSVASQSVGLATVPNGAGSAPAPVQQSVVISAISPNGMPTRGQAASLSMPTSNGIMPTFAPTPPGKFIVVNNGPGDQTDPHVSGDLVVYSNSDGTNFTIRYFNLATGVDAGVPNNGTFDFLADVRGSVITYTRVSSASSSIFTFDTSTPSVPPVEVDPLLNAMRQAAQIGDQTIAWQDNGFSNSSNIADIVAYDRQSGTATRLANDSALNQFPAISPDGKVIVWTKCAGVSGPCAVWQATSSNGAWIVQQLVSQVGGNQSHPDTDGSIIAYGADNGSGDQVFWQPVSGGTEQGLSLSGGQGTTPSVSGGPQASLIAFAYRPSNSGNHDIVVYNPATNVLYDITKDVQPGYLIDKQLNDISVTSDGMVRVVWQAQEGDENIYAYTFTMNTTASISNIISQLLAAGCINNSGIANAFTSKLSAAQSSINIGDTKGAINILEALINQLNAQANKHITATCTIGGTTFNPDTLLINDVQSLINII